jgi:hypothetical protein
MQGLGGKFTQYSEIRLQGDGMSAAEGAGRLTTGSGRSKRHEAMSKSGQWISSWQRWRGQAGACDLEELLKVRRIVDLLCGSIPGVRLDLLEGLGPLHGLSLLLHIVPAKSRIEQPRGVGLKGTSDARAKPTAAETTRRAMGGVIRRRRLAAHRRSTAWWMACSLDPDDASKYGAVAPSLWCP